MELLPLITAKIMGVVDGAACAVGIEGESQVQFGVVP